MRLDAYLVPQCSLPFVQFRELLAILAQYFGTGSGTNIPLVLLPQPSVLLTNPLVVVAESVEVGGPWL